MTFFARGKDGLVVFESSPRDPFGSQSWVPWVKAPRVVFDVGCALGCSLFVGPENSSTDAFDFALVCVEGKCGLAILGSVPAADNEARGRKGIGRIDDGAIVSEWSNLHASHARISLKTTWRRRWRAANSLHRFRVFSPLKGISGSSSSSSSALPTNRFLVAE